MLYYEWKEEDAIKYAKEEGYEEGIAHGIEQGIEEGIEHGAAQKQQELIRKFSQKLSADDIAETLQLPAAYVLEVLNTKSDTE